MHTLDPTLDIVFKLLFGGPKSQQILIALLTAVLQPQSPITKVTILNPGIPDQLERIENCNDVKTLDAWFDRALTLAPDDLFDL